MSAVSVSPSASSDGGFAMIPASPVPRCLPSFPQSVACEICPRPNAPGKPSHGTGMSGLRHPRQAHSPPLELDAAAEPFQFTALPKSAECPRSIPATRQGHCFQTFPFPITESQAHGFAVRQIPTSADAPFGAAPKPGAQRTARRQARAERSTDVLGGIRYWSGLGATMAPRPVCRLPRMTGFEGRPT